MNDWFDAGFRIGQPTRQIVVGLIVLAAASGSATVVMLAWESHHPSLADQIALTAGYRAIL